MSNKIKLTCLLQIEVQIHKDEPLPVGWAMDMDGQVTTDPKKVNNQLPSKSANYFMEGTGRLIKNV